jgi:pimeloyl-ACP methyl ester carboxylesterase
MTQIKRQMNRANPVPQVNRHPACMAFPIAVLLLLIFLVGTKREHLPEVKQAKTAMNIEEGSLSNGISYYHCNAMSEPAIVLLHGAAFTKEDWKTSGILQDFCGQAHVLALDLSVKATSIELKELFLKELEALGFQLPVTTVITPSASGSAITEWIQTDVSTLGNYLQTWIPVASNSVQKLTPEEMQKIKIPVLAIYGDQDKSGQESMEMLRDHGGATLQELPGRHPVYLDVPEPFVRVVMDYLQQQK